MGQPPFPFNLKQKHHAILSFAGVPLDPYNRTEEYRQNLKKKLVEGLYFFDDTLKYWVNRQTGDDCFALYAKKLSITGDDDPSFWKWYRDPQEGRVELAESSDVSWLSVRLRFSSVNLQQNTLYRVLFKVKVKNREMLRIPLNLKLVLPNGSKQENPKKVTGFDQWEELEVGTFRTTYENVGIIDVSLQNLDDSLKKGLVIKSAEFVAMTG